MKIKLGRVLFDSPDTGFHICKAVVLDYSTEELPKQVSPVEGITVKGYFPLTKIVTLAVKGEWEKSKYGYTLQVQNFEEIIPSSTEGIISYLSTSVYGVKETTAKKIVQRFGLRTIEVFENTPEELLTVQGIGRKKLIRIIESFKRTRSMQAIVSYLAPLGISTKKCSQIIKKFGNASMDIILNDPFRLCEIEGFGFLTVDELARKTSFSLTAPLRIKSAIHWVLQVAATEGHLCLPQKNCIVSAYLILNGVDFRREKANKAIISYVETNNHQIFNLVQQETVSLKKVIEQFKTMALAYDLMGDNGYVYLPTVYNQECEIAQIMGKRLSQKNTANISEQKVSEVIAKQEKKLGISLASKQKEAVMLGVKEKTCIITGGPGVGKTTVLKVVLEACVECYTISKSDISLLAPTGRAAQRMAESVGNDYTASTIHSALHIGGEQEYAEPLYSAIVVVDEASMIDNQICWLLLKSIPSTAKLIIIGDPEQLPSVGAGNVLYEFLKCGLIPTVKLDVIYRQSGLNPIVKNSSLIQKGVTDLQYEKDFQFFEIESDSNRQQETADIVIEQFLAAVKEQGLDEVQVLCPFRKKGVIAGATELNRSIQERINPQSPNKPQVKRGERIFRVGDKVIQTKNDKDLGVYNGDIGYIKAINVASEEIAISFNDNTYIFDASQLTDVELAYAISIHKSQGSEYQTAIIPVLTDFYIMLRRNLIYTGITRAKTKVVLVGQKKALSQAITTNVIAKRNTQLSTRIISCVSQDKSSKKNEQLKLI